ncbi:A/G-specific adenine glycosylase [Flavobacterium sp. NST-5]|uniref:Adenine DNA glycosylase n=1 Tax=Flavobacterium ichthyis TaxID=2698827 RepID=A0ABW9Z9L0_9FLAO|nr:A/G-specific adenine glycosylase [Flavobacterium ichthyis]NBL63765.1 A/G-specific adenine glycosylase [Flavobacterium ichthyis]
MNFSNVLIQWYLQNKRDLPWRNTTNPYLIWLSEIILQQTRVVQGLPYFLAFAENFPTVFDLASAEEEKVLKLWQGLGYYSRARNLHQAAKFIAQDLKGNFPASYKDLLTLKGVGEYTAAAIASFSYNEVVPVVDGNVFRVLARFFDIETDISQPKAKKEFTELANLLIPKNNPAIFNQAIMEFGALQCVPKNPDCQQCPLQSGCLAFAKNKIGQLPVKSKKIKPKSRYFNYLVFEDNLKNTVIQKRTGKGIWQNLYEFPLLELENLENDSYISHEIHKKFGSEYEIEKIIPLTIIPILHKLTHQSLYIRFFKVEVNGTISNAISWESIDLYPFPVIIFNFLQKKEQ